MSLQNHPHVLHMLKKKELIGYSTTREAVLQF